ncbi:hypothetical protein [Streptomyces yanii]|uniref:hypothetical protein n=1 Tax=Streptomyces yanii TaxID=78510 RepID=UPI0031E7CED9
MLAEGEEGQVGEAFADRLGSVNPFDVVARGAGRALLVVVDERGDHGPGGEHLAGGGLEFPQALFHQPLHGDRRIGDQHCVPLGKPDQAPLL